jgi:hypothetical protein
MSDGSFHGQASDHPPRDRAARHSLAILLRDHRIPDPGGGRGTARHGMPGIGASGGPGLLSIAISLAARNASLETIDPSFSTYGLSRPKAFIIASVGMGLRIGQLVAAPKAGVTAMLPPDIFEERDH